MPLSRVHQRLNRPQQRLTLLPVKAKDATLARQEYFKWRCLAQKALKAAARQAESTPTDGQPS